jgi:hypothetical protein
VQATEITVTGSRLAEYVLAMALGVPPAGTAWAVPSREEFPAAQLPRADASEPTLRVDTELLRSDLRVQKVAALTEIMQFTEAQDAAFWLVCREYECDLALLNDERLAIIDSYTRVFGALTDGTANELMVKALDLASRRTALQQQYYARLRTALSPRTAALALQIEYQIQLVIDLQVAASLPVRR